MNLRRLGIYSSIVLFFLPTLTFAQTTGGLVPPCNNPTVNGVHSICGLCDFYTLIQHIVNFLIGLSIPIAVFLFAYAGFLYFTSAANPGNIGQARKIFTSALIGFLIAISGWLLVQTIINALVNPGYLNGWSWNTLSCANTNRPGITGPQANLTVTDWLGGVLGNLTPPTPVSVVPTQTGGGVGCTSAGGQCYQCYAAMQALATPQIGLQTPTQEICYQALQFIGTDTSGDALTPSSQCGPSPGQQPGSPACAWSVNTILGYAGLAPIWNQCNVVPFANQMRSGIVQLKNQSQATCGDLVIEGSDGHIGICANLGCTLAISNSSTPKTFTQCTGPRLDDTTAPPLGFFRVTQ